MLIKKIKGPEKMLESLKEKEFYLKQKIFHLKKLLSVLDTTSNVYARQIFLEIHELELDLQVVEENINIQTKEMLRLLDFYQTKHKSEDEPSKTIIIPIGAR